MGNQIVFDDVQRVPSQGMVINGRTVGVGEIHLRYTPGVQGGCIGSPKRFGTCLLTDKKLYFVPKNTRSELIVIPVDLISSINVSRFFGNLCITANAVSYYFNMHPVDLELWKNEIVKLKKNLSYTSQPSQNKDHQKPRDNSPQANSSPENKTYKYCRYCGTKLEREAAYCLACGKEL